MWRSHCTDDSIGQHDAQLSFLAAVESAVLSYFVVNYRGNRSENAANGEDASHEEPSEQSEEEKEKEDENDEEKQEEKQEEVEEEVEMEVEEVERRKS
ncbi:hypothetical protein HZH66_013711 [Vespula vulgaris]|uniref:Uncharacterized protein n=1 Tax=Vespula vulgaris TaxID=7454 RepID=A0A834MQ96_VESVU|nr:hypothetical protein HZH66_013711 [Vespula vulgaris]